MARAYYGSRISAHLIETPEGYLVCKNVPIARTGVQDYRGSEFGADEPEQLYHVTRPQNEVFSPAAVASFEGKPVVDEHPDEDVTPDNYNRYESCYRDYAINVGYGYNWVFHHNWLFNVTVTPSLGIKRGKSDTINGSHTIMTANLRGRLALVRHCGRFFYGFHGFFNGYTYRCKKYTMYNQINDFPFTAGFRF